MADILSFANPKAIVSNKLSQVGLSLKKIISQIIHVRNNQNKTIIQHN